MAPFKFVSLFLLAALIHYCSFFLYLSKVINIPWTTVCPGFLMDTEQQISISWSLGWVVAVLLSRVVDGCE